MNNNSSMNTVLLIIILVLIVGGGVWWFATHKAAQDTQDQTGLQINVGDTDGGAQQ
jgi:hypothetical protein